MRILKRLAVMCVLFTGTAFGQDAATRELVEDRILRNVAGERGFEQVIASNAFTREVLPPAGVLTSEYVTLLADALRPKNAFKVVTWTLCVSPQPEADGTVLVIDSVQTVFPGRSHGRAEVRYRTLRSSGSHTTQQTWPYAVLILRGMYAEVVCRPVEG